MVKANLNKKRESSVSKSKSKADHKPEYVDCLLICKGEPHKSSYCKICGKVGNIEWFAFTPCGTAALRMMTLEEIYKKYAGLQQIKVDDLSVKFIPVP